MSKTTTIVGPKPTKVIFRKGKNKDKSQYIIALFPEIQATQFRSECQSYMTIGQHGTASYLIVNLTKPATQEEYANLKTELESIGYDLEVRKRINKRWFEIKQE